MQILTYNDLITFIDKYINDDYFVDLIYRRKNNVHRVIKAQSMVLTHNNGNSFNYIGIYCDKDSDRDYCRIFENNIQSVELKDNILTVFFLERYHPWTASGISNNYRKYTIKFKVYSSSLVNIQI